MLPLITTHILVPRYIEHARRQGQTRYIRILDITKNITRFKEDQNRAKKENLIFIENVCLYV